MMDSGGWPSCFRTATLAGDIRIVGRAAPGRNERGDIQNMENRSAAQLEEEPEEEEAGHLPARLQLAPVGEWAGSGGSWRGEGRGWLFLPSALRPLIAPQDNNTIALICAAHHSRSGQVSLPTTWPAMSSGLKGQSNSEFKLQPFAPLISDGRRFTGPHKHKASAVPSVATGAGPIVQAGSQ